MGFPGDTVVKNPPADTGDVVDINSILGSGRFPGGENGNPLQYSCLENPMDTGVWQTMAHTVTKSQTQLIFFFSYLDSFYFFFCPDCCGQHFQNYVE